MSTDVFNKGYADSYDLLYADKDYGRECDLVQQAFGQHSTNAVESVLDLGCGTGNHTIELARRGFEVLGVDLSDDMLVAARAKADGAAVSAESLEFVPGDVRTFSTSKKFDAALMMFAVLGYQLTNDDVLAALCTVRNHVKPGGLFICDVWYGPAVLTIGPSDRVKVIPTEDGQLIRAASGTLDTYRHLCEVRYHLWRLSGDRVASETQETHMMRYFFPQELAFMFQQAGLELLDMRAFDDPDRKPDETTWNVMVVGNVSS